jgi:uncharacterized damage-inducible protein DinB
MPLPNAARDYLLKGIESTPTILRALTIARADDDPAWDRRSDPDRFTLREALAHLADWEPIWLERFQRIRVGDHPFLPSVDEGALAIENRYSEIAPSQSLAKQREGRRSLTAYLRSIRDDEWDLTCDREFVGVLTLQQLAMYILAHDAYHLEQVAEGLAPRQEKH